MLVSHINNRQKHLSKGYFRLQLSSVFVQSSEKSAGSKNNFIFLWDIRYCTGVLLHRNISQSKNTRDPHPSHCLAMQTLSHLEFQIRNAGCMLYNLCTCDSHGVSLIWQIFQVYTYWHRHNEPLPPLSTTGIKTYSFLLSLKHYPPFSL